MQILPIEGGICAPQGFLAASTHCGFAKKRDKKDLMLVYSRVECAAAAMYTQNKVKAAPIRVTRAHLDNGTAQAIVCNSGNANACTADGYVMAKRCCAAAGRALNLPQHAIVVASTGVIGQKMDATLIENAIPALKESLAATPQASADACAAIMTTDTMPKEIAIQYDTEETRIKIGGIAKGSGMIHPDMATMLAFITTDAAITTEMLDKALKLVVPDTFNMISVDGDTSTNDMVTVLANGIAKNTLIDGPGEAFDDFVRGLMHVCIYLARMMAKDGEGATKLLECLVYGAPDDDSARAIAKSVISSNLLKSAMFGEDANWGRVLCAMGYAGAEFDPTKVGVSFASTFGQVVVCENGAGVEFSEEDAKLVLGADEIEIRIELSQGPSSAVAWGCDLTYDYVKINGDYRS